MQKNTTAVDGPAFNPAAKPVDHPASHLRLPYRPISEFYWQQFGERVRKISVSTAQSCPNRDGIRGMKTCNFCDAWGSAAFPEKAGLSVTKQIADVRQMMLAKYPAKKFLVYFQAYTSTFAKTALLRSQFNAASEFSDVVGFVVGTRPDCLSAAVLDLWNEFCVTKFLSVELGVQSFNDEQLVWMRRGHTAADSIQAIHRIAGETTVDLGIHLMFGLPGEDRAQVIAAARLCNELPINNVKLHNLHVLKNTPLADEFKAGRFTPIEREDYFDRCRVFLEHLNPEIFVHRLSALANKPEELIAPKWTSQKMKTYQNFIDYMNARGSFQGRAL